jgi:eukaryotic phosphomannomutase
MRLVAFDLDDTLAPSKSALPSAMAEQLRALLDVVPVCVISGGEFGQFRAQLLENLDASSEQLSKLHLMPTCGTRYYRWNADHSSWDQVYANDLSQDERERAIESLRQRAHEQGVWEAQPWGEIIEDRGSQITFSALGQQAPLEAKRAWDPSGDKKRKLRDAVALDVPDLEVRAGGSTSVDITRRGIDKAYGMAKLVEMTGIAPHDMLFIGDRLDEAGNDYPVKAAGYPTRPVAGWEECVEVIAQIVSELSVRA